MISYFRRVLFLSFLIQLSIFSTFAQTERVEKDIATVMERHNVVGIAVAVVKNNKMVYTKSFGLKDIESGTPLSNEHIFRIASISKSFSATSILQLIENGKLSLDDDFSNLVGFRIRNPKFPEKVITLRMIMSHTSSINDSQGYFNLDVINPDVNPNYAKCYSDYAPGMGYKYCNLNFNMVGAVIERTSGERFDVYVRRHVLEPLGLYGGYCVDSLDKTLFATLYEFDSSAGKYLPSPQAYAPRSEEINNYKMGYTTPIFSPTGGMKISATDLAKYMMMHMNYGKTRGKRVISKKNSKIMQTPLSGEEGYGLAISNISDLIPGKLMTGHTGSAYGLYSAMFFHPKEKFGIVVIINGANGSYTNGIRTVLRESINVLYSNLVADNK